MMDKSLPRRRFLTRASATLAGALAGSHSAKAQIGTQRPRATTLVRPADTILKNGKVITVDRSFPSHKQSLSQQTASSRSDLTRR
jgi:hypothetical protein